MYINTPKVMSWIWDILQKDLSHLTRNLTLGKTDYKKTIDYFATIAFNVVFP